MLKKPTQKQVEPKDLPPGWEFDSSQEEYYRALMIPLDLIEPWRAGQMRKIFDPVKLQELADSIKEKGVVQPILVRQVTVIPNGTIHLKNQFEIVAGERRWRASKLAGVAAIPAIVRDLDDKAAVEIQVIENLQRADLSPLEEAAGYDALIKAHGYTADTLAAKIGKSRSYVYARLKINNIPELCRQALERGDISASVAELIGRIPNAEMREDFWSRIEEDRYEDEPFPPFRDIKDDIERQCMRELKGAPFDQGDKKLLPEAGSCKACLKRTGNNRVEFPEGRADICTDTACFAQKVAAHNQRLISELSADGVKVATSEQSKKLIGYGGMLNYDAAREWVNLDTVCHSDTGRISDDTADIDDNWEPRMYAELLGDSVKPELLVPTEAGGVQRLLSRKKAAEILREQHGIELKAKASSSDDDWKARQKKEVEARSLRELTLSRAQARVAEEFADDFFNRRGNHDALLRVIAKAVAVQNFNAGTNVLKRRGISVKPGERDERTGEYVNTLDAADCIGLIAEIGLNAQLNNWATWGYGKTESEILGYADVDLKEIEKQVTREQKEVAKAKAKPKGKGASKQALKTGT